MKRNLLKLLICNLFNISIAMESNTLLDPRIDMHYTNFHKKIDRLIEFIGIDLTIKQEYNGPIQKFEECLQQLTIIRQEFEQPRQNAEESLKEHTRIHKTLEEQRKTLQEQRKTLQEYLKKFEDTQKQIEDKQKQIEGMLESLEMRIKNSDKQIQKSKEVVKKFIILFEKIDKTIEDNLAKFQRR